MVDRLFHDPKLKKLLISKKYKFITKIAAGSYGEVYSVLNIKTGERFAAKLEDASRNISRLLIEKKVYQILGQEVGFPEVKWYGKDCRKHYYNVLIMTLLGPSLDVLHSRCNHIFSLKTVLMLADSMISRIQTIHQAGFIHRDIKPGNFLIGRGNFNNVIFVCDLGFAERYIDENTGLHIPQSSVTHFTGTRRFASLHAHALLQQSRRDDLEALGYVFVYFLKGILPWQGIKHEDEELKNEMVHNVKRTTSIDTLCSGLPAEFFYYMKYCKGLKFDETPNYHKLKHKFKSLFSCLEFNFDYKFDWPC